jgi:hypothetical protein
MAYIGQDKKKELLPKLKAVLRKYGTKGTFSIRNHSTLIVTLNSSTLPVSDWSDFLLDRLKESGHADINMYYPDRYATGRNLEFLKELSEAMNEGNHDNSDLMSDYFDVGWYTSILFGNYDKPFVL